MDDFGVLARDFGYKPQGKSAPMAPKPNSSAFRSPSSSSDHNHDGALFDDVFGGPPKYTGAESSDFDYDSIFKSSSSPATTEPKKASGPVYDKPVYDEDIFDGLPGMKTRSESRFDNDGVFAENRSAPFDDLLGNLNRSEKKRTSERGFDDLLPGFGVGSPSPTSRDRPRSNSSRATKVSADATKPSFDDDPFVVLDSTSTPTVSSPGLFTDPLEEISKLGQSGYSKDSSPVAENVFADINPNGFGTSVPGVSSEKNYGMANGSPTRTGSSMSREQVGIEPLGRSFRDSGRHSKNSIDGFQESYNSMFDMPSTSTDSHKPVGQAASPPYKNAEYFETNSHASRESEEEKKVSDDVWLTVAEIPLFTQPTSAPPPSRPPPRIPGRVAKSEAGSVNFNPFKKGYEFPSSPSSTQQSQSPNPARSSFKSTPVSQVDELQNFSMSGTRNNVDGYSDIHSGEEVNPYTSAAASADAMKEAMDRAEAKFRHAKEVREREYVKTARSKDDTFLEKEGNDMQDDLEKLDREQKQEEERERRRLEKEQERAREREMARQAVERATREARERAAAEARERASVDARMKAEKAAVQRAQAEARERAGKAAVQRVQAEARERAAAEARERAEKVAAEARERANAEAREKEMRDKAAASKAEAEARRRAERAAVERAAAEARGRAAAEARDRAAAAASAARMNQQKTDDDFESFFSTASRPSSVPRPRTNSSEPVPDPQFQSKGGTDAARRTSSVGTSSNIRKTSSATNIVDDLTSIFGGAPSSGDFQDIEGETEERRRMRLERHQRTQERAAKAVAEKNQRDLQAQREQEERYRMAGTLDNEIKRWSAGKEGNLRALLSTLQYVLWPECGWQPVSLTDLITGANVKKAYRKATLCIHPDKVQQKGASLQQKYIAEKVFDLLKEAWNKFNSEELF